MEDSEIKLKKLQILENQKKLRAELPHIYGFPFYKWAREFYESRNKVNLLVAANQVSKSSTQIRKCIHWATSPELWPELWRTTPHQFWYMYPSLYLASVEFEKKWVPEFLPRGELKEHPVYGWRAVYRAGYIQAIHFNSGLSVYFKTYSQDASDLQASSVYAIFSDEELPIDLLSELQFRLAATDGYFHLVMTPTLGQEFWREAVEMDGPRRKLPESARWRVSMYDCLHYEDGTPSFWTIDRIERIRNSCKSEAEVQRRIYGRFVADSGLKYPAFQRDRNLIDPIEVPRDYMVYCGVDPGSGGDNHPAAVTFVAVSPDFKKGYIIAGKRFDNTVTTNSDVVALVQEMRNSIRNDVIATYYDWHSADIREISTRMGESWIPAEKSHAIGEQVINVLFKNQMLYGFRTEELDSLYSELTSLRVDTRKNEAHDDFADSCRYCVSKIPWDWSVIKGEKIEIEHVPTEKERRRDAFFGKWEELKYDAEQEIQEWNDLYGT